MLKNVKKKENRSKVIRKVQNEKKKRRISLASIIACDRNAKCKQERQMVKKKRYHTREKTLPTVSHQNAIINTHTHIETDKQTTRPKNHNETNEGKSHRQGRL